MTTLIEEIRALLEAGPRGHIPLVAYAIAHDAHIHREREEHRAEIEKLRVEIEGLRAQLEEHYIAMRVRQLEHALDAERQTVRQLREALTDMLNGWRYIRETHGDLAGVGWDRAEQKAFSALEGRR